MSHRRWDRSFSAPLVYRIRVLGHLDPAFSDYARGMAITTYVAPGEQPVSTLHGECPDHSALVGILNALGSFGWQIISVEYMGTPAQMDDQV